MQATQLTIGTRKVRSAGRASGSIEITLPPELAALEGMSCRIVLREGARPEIVLEPDLAPAAAVFTRVWTRLGSLLCLAGDIGEFPPQECALALLPSQPQNGRPLLIYSHAWLISRLWADPAEAASPVPLADRRTALAGLVAPLATIAGHRLGLIGPMAVSFGAVLANLTTPQDHRSNVAADNFESNAARCIWNTACGTNALPLNALTAQSGEELAQDALRRIVSQFRTWQEHPDQYALARAQWLEIAPITFPKAHCL